MNSRTIYLPEVVPPGPPGIGGLRLGNTLLQAKQGENGEDEKETDAERRTRRINLYKAWKRRVYNRMTMNPAEDIATNPAYKWRLSVKDRLKSEGTQPWTEIDHVVLYDANKQDWGNRPKNLPCCSRRMRSSSRPLRARRQLFAA